MMAGTKGTPLNVLRRFGRWLVVDFEEPHEVLSWAVAGGGRRRASSVAWCQVTPEELKSPVDPADFLRGKMAAAGLGGGVGLMTSCDLDLHAVSEKEAGPYGVMAVATAGFANALRVGDEPFTRQHAGTVNILCRVSHPLSEEAMVEALSIAAEARTAAVLEAGIPSRASGLPATGTGTDCIVIAAPLGSTDSARRPLVGGKIGAAPVGSLNAIRYAGKHTVIGHLIGAAVLEAVQAAAARWKERGL